MPTSDGSLFQMVTDGLEKNPITGILGEIIHVKGWHVAVDANLNAVGCIDLLLLLPKTEFVAVMACPESLCRSGCQPRPAKPFSALVPVAAGSGSYQTKA